MAIAHIARWVSYLLFIVPVAAGFSMTFYAIKRALTQEDDVITMCNSRMKKILIGAILAETISGLITLVETFYM